MANQGDWVQVHIVVLTPDERAANIPEDTKAVPLEMWVKGHLATPAAKIGDTVTITTRTGRTVCGQLVQVNPSYNHSFGDFVPELLQIDDMVWGMVFGGDDNA